MALRRIAYIDSRAAHRCLKDGCKGKLGSLKDGKAAKCPICGTVHLIKITENGKHVILTDKDKRHFFGEYQTKKKKS